MTRTPATNPNSVDWLLALASVCVVAAVRPGIQLRRWVIARALAEGAAAADGAVLAATGAGFAAVDDARFGAAIVAPGWPAIYDSSML